MDPDVLINELKAQAMTDVLTDPVTQNLVLFGIAEARMRVIKSVGQEDEDWLRSLPGRPFDMEFFASVLISMFSKKEILRAVLNGQDLAEASGWDV